MKISRAGRLIRESILRTERGADASGEACSPSRRFGLQFIRTLFRLAALGFLPAPEAFAYIVGVEFETFADVFEGKKRGVVGF